MASLSTALANALLDLVTGNGSYTPPSALYIALQTGANSSRDGTVQHEVSGGGYTRIAVSFGAAVSGSTDNTGIVDFGVATADWGTITNAALCTSATGDTAINYGTLSTAKAVYNGDGAQFRIGNISWALS